MGSRVQCNEFGDETNQRLVEPGMSAKRFDTSMRLVGDDFCVAARQKQMQTRCELSMWEIFVCERDDRLEIKQFPYSPRQEALPRYEFFDSELPEIGIDCGFFGCDKEDVLKESSMKVGILTRQP